MSTRQFIAGGFGIALAFGSVAALAQEVSGSFRRELEVAAPLELDVGTGSGSITVRGGTRDRAVVVGRITARERRGRTADDLEELVRELESAPPIELTGNRLRVGHLEGSDYNWNISISYEIDVPVQTQVIARTGSGSQTISRIDGAVNVSTGSGSLALADIQGSVEAHTGSGSIRAERIGGGFRADTGSGSVRLAQSAPGDVAITTGSGRAEVQGVDGSLRLHTGSGGLTVDGTPRGTWDLKTGSGSIVVQLPQGAAFNLEAHAGSGGVFSDHPVAMRGSIERGRISGAVRGGGPTVRARTGSGGIRIE